MHLSNVDLFAIIKYETLWKTKPQRSQFGHLSSEILSCVATSAAQFLFCNPEKSQLASQKHCEINSLYEALKYRSEQYNKKGKQDSEY